MTAPDAIHRLVEKFETHKKHFTGQNYNEETLRSDFLNEFFEALGWDIGNKKNYSPNSREVVMEAVYKHGDRHTSPDYVFRLGNITRFFVEAKKPAIEIYSDVGPAFQLRHYGWTAKLPLSILCDFEEFAVYDCRFRPIKTDKAAVARINFFTYKDYVDHWDEIASVFSREAVLNGSLDRYAEETKGKKGTADVDDAILAEIEGWRAELARNLALRNPTLTAKDLNYAVQMTIDRILFLRIAEDRGIEPDGQLQSIAGGKDIYAGLVHLYQQADLRYNSGLFHFKDETGRGTHADSLTPTLALDDRVLKGILTNLYYPDCPYAWQLLPVEILGQVYEQFLGKVIRMTPAHQVKVEEKPEVRKAGGVYYTPAYIVDYIVKHTLGSLLEGKTPELAAALTVVDPACGSGSFLLGAYQYLLDWHLAWYLAHDPEKWAKGASPALVQGKDGWRLTLAKKRDILLANIHGVDIDPQAVEVTKLSLLLKVLEGVAVEEAQPSLRMERMLPDLGGNIQCGNSLIGPDYYDGRQMALLEADEVERVNAFDWQRAFPAVFARGGFDVVIGNPPYVRQELLGSQKTYFQKQYRVYQGTADLYAYFIERGVGLLRQDGLFGYIVANKWMRANYGEALRRFLTGWQLEQVVDFGDLPVFEQATTYPCILVIRKAEPARPVRACNIKTLAFGSLEEEVAAQGFELPMSSLAQAGWTLADERVLGLLRKLQQQGVPLGEYVHGKIYRGVLTGLNEAFVIDADTRARLIAEDARSAEVIKPFLLGRDIKRYEEPKAERYLILMPRGWTREQMKGKGISSSATAWKWLRGAFPAVAAHLEPFAEAAEKRFDKGEYWWELRACDYYGEFEKPKILLPDISLRGNFMFDKGGFYAVNTAYIIGADDFHLLGLLNSNLITFVYKNISAVFRGGYLRFIYQYLETLPIMKKNDDRMVGLVEQMLGLHARRAAAHTPHEVDLLTRQIDATDHAIDALVYELYGLTDAEIRIVEGG